MSQQDYSKVDLAWNNLTCTVPSIKDATKPINILCDVSGYARSTRITSIMGPSGAGKTTLMNILAGRRNKYAKIEVQGEVTVNSQPVDARLFKKATCYVQQEDLLPSTETVRECLTFNAHLRLPESMSSSDKHARVLAVMEELGLDSCADTLIGDAQIKGISGGQKRRLSVALELITAPSCIFLDEPTSGLDSEIAMTIMQTLNDLARKGRTVILTIHQPNSDITDLFDDYILMALGDVVYAGPWEQCVPFFASAGFDCPQFKNPADYFMRVVSEKGGEAVKPLAAVHRARFTPSKRATLQASVGEDSVAQGHVSVDVPAEDDPFKGQAIMMERSSFGTQLYQLLARNARQWMRHPIMLVGEAFQYILLSLFVGSMYFDITTSAEKGSTERGAALFFMLVTIVFTPPFTTATVWQSERSLVRSEIEQGTYTLGAFYVSKMAALFPVEISFALVVSVISYFMFGLQNDAGKFFIYSLILAITLLISESWGTLCSLASKTAEIAIVLMTLIFIVLLSFTGFLVADTPVYYVWIEKLSFLRYANSALFQNEMKGLTLFDSDGNPVRGEDVLKTSALDSDLSVWENIAVLFAMLVALRILAFGALCLARKMQWM